MPVVSALAKGERVYLSSRTDLQWRTMLVVSFEPVPMSPRAAHAVYALAVKDEDLAVVRVEGS